MCTPEHGKQYCSCSFKYKFANWPTCSSTKHEWNERGKVIRRFFLQPLFFLLSSSSLTLFLSPIVSIPPTISSLPFWIIVRTNSCERPRPHLHRSHSFLEIWIKGHFVLVKKSGQNIFLLFFSPSGTRKQPSLMYLGRKNKNKKTTLFLWMRVFQVVIVMIGDERC